MPKDLKNPWGYAVIRGIPKSTVHKVVHKRLCQTAYKLQLLHDIRPTDKKQRSHFAVSLVYRIEENNNFLNNVVYTDAANFHISGTVN